jgi:beta-galactosidase
MVKKILIIVLFITCCINQPFLPEEDGPFRRVISLDGEWELLKSTTLNISQTKGDWEKIRVPHNLSVWDGIHKAWYKCRFSGVNAPKVVLAFDSVNFRCVVYINKKLVGEHTGGYLPFEIDITKYVKETNELLVGVEDVTAVLKKETIPDFLGEGAPDSILYPVGSGFHIFGIWQSVSIKTYPRLYVKDVFIKPSYRTKTLSVDITVTNEDTLQRTVAIKNEVVDGFEFSHSTISLDPSETKTITVTKEWESPVLWSPETPHVYTVKTTLLNAELIDQVETRFGFREFWVEDGNFYLNGTPIILRGSSKHLLGDPWTGNHRQDAEETLTRVKAVHSNVLRLHANPYPEVFLDTADEMGILIIDESALWCLSNQYDLGSDEFWENTQEHIKTMVTRDRNHPSLVIWSVENEILLCGGYNEQRCRDELIQLGDIIKQLDPTRPIMYEGDYDLPNADIINLHYPHEYPRWTVFPNEAYFIDEPVVIDSYPQTTFFWDRKKPLYIGEFLWIPPSTPHPHTIFYGDNAFIDHDLYRDKAKGEAWKMYVEAFRSQRVNGFCPWNVLEGGEYPTPLSEALDGVFTPLFGFIKEYSTNFFSGQNVEKTLVVCNDTYQRKEIAIAWTAGVESGEFTTTLEPAECTEIPITFRAPHTDKKEFFEFFVSIVYDSQEFTIKKVYNVYPERKCTITGDILLYDPVGETKKILDQNNIVYQQVDTLGDYTCDLFIIGYHALPETDALLSIKGNILCFEQEALSLPGLHLTDHASTIVFERIPLFNVDDTALRFWQNDHLVSKNDIAKPYSGNYRPLMDSGGSGGLEYTPLLEYDHRNGTIVFCQLLLTEKYFTEPVAQVMYKEVMEYALNVEWSPKILGVKGDAGFLATLPVEYTTSACDVLFVTEYSNPEEVQSFAAHGGVVWLHGLAVDEINHITNAAITISPLTHKDLPVLLVEDELTYGLSHQEFYWTGERTQWWVPLSTDIADAFITNSTGVPLTTPCILLKIPYKKGYFIIDMMHWEKNPVDATRIVSTILTNVGIPMKTPYITLEAETMPIEKVHLGERGDNFYAFYTEGYLGANVTFKTSGVYTFRLYAWADVVAGEGAVVEVYLDKILMGTVEITSKGVYDIEFYVEQGVHEVGIAFTNDYYSPPDDRNIYVDKIEIYSENIVC